MKRKNLILCTIIFGAIIAISGYSEGNYGAGFSAPETYQRPRAAQKAPNTRPTPRHPNAAETQPVAAEKGESQNTKPMEKKNEVEKEAGKLY